jgi:LIVCS family branched-chain amino acid:cation transporter
MAFWEPPMKPTSIFTTSLGLFAMFFGAGNVVFPLYVGLIAGENLLLAMLGLLITAVALPLISLFAIVQFRGQQDQYFQRVGVWGGRALLLISLFLLGPFLVVPRTINVAHSAISETLLPTSAWLFGLFYCVLVLMLAFNTRTMLQVISKAFTPLMLVLLGALFVAGLLEPAQPMPSSLTGSAFLFGLEEGYFTLDAIAALVFGQFVYLQLRQQEQKLPHDAYKKHVFLAALLAAFLLSAVYIAMGFSIWLHSTPEMLAPDQKQALLILVTKQILPASWSGLAGVIIAAACLTTATALSKIFADYLHHYARHKHWPISESVCLVISLVIAFAMSLIGFDGLMKAFIPVILAVYPIFILLALHTFLQRWIPAKYVPWLALITLGLGILTIF